MNFEQLEMPVCIIEICPGVTLEHVAHLLEQRFPKLTVVIDRAKFSKFALLGIARKCDYEQIFKTTLAWHPIPSNEHQPEIAGYWRETTPATIPVGMEKLISRVWINCPDAT